ncbi:hypothetical protein ACIRBZ_03580 [Streptomyces sp. NPDC094038]|uniref:hypothetical protein n=1 Tax=Streptomyces sp. NPDC094038 TaxID=3366055 RepID=UPI003804DC01
MSDGIDSPARRYWLTAPRPQSTTYDLPLTTRAQEMPYRVASGGGPPLVPSRVRDSGAPDRDSDGDEAAAAVRAPLHWATVAAVEAASPVSTVLRLAV